MESRMMRAIPDAKPGQEYSLRKALPQISHLELEGRRCKTGVVIGESCSKR